MKPAPNSIRPAPQVLIAEMEHEALVGFMQKLIPLITELGLIGPSLKASVITSICRNYRTRMQVNSFNALELAQRIAEYDPLVIDGFEISASFENDLSTGRRTGYLQFSPSSNCINSTGPNYIKSVSEIALEEGRCRIRRERVERRLERERNHRFCAEMRLMEHQNRLRRNIELERQAQSNDTNWLKDVVVEDNELIDHLRSLMLMSNTETTKTIIRSEENGI